MNKNQQFSSQQLKKNGKGFCLEQTCFKQ